MADAQSFVQGEKRCHEQVVLWDRMSIEMIDGFHLLTDCFHIGLKPKVGYGKRNNDHCIIPVVPRPWREWKTTLGDQNESHKIQIIHVEQ